MTARFGAVIILLFSASTAATQVRVLELADIARSAEEISNQADVPPLSVAGLFRVRGYCSRTSARCFA